MSIVSKALIHTAVLWPAPTTDDYGVLTFGTPVEIRCRWHKVQNEIVDDDGATLISKALVMVDRDIEMNCYLMLGEIDSTTPANPTGTEGAWRVLQFKKIPFPLIGREYYRAVYL